MKWLSGGWEPLLKIVYMHPVAGLSAVFLAGMVFWGGFNWSLELTNTESFCISCHPMREYVYKEYRKSIHFANRTGVRASCPDCHVPKEWVYKVVRKVRATNELFHWLRGSIDTPEKFEARRLELARHVWASMEATDSRECRNCHGIGFMSPEEQGAEARTMHVLGDKWGKTCIDCHQGIVHSLPQGFDKEAVMDKLHDRMEKEEVDCRPCHEDMAGPPPGEGWE
jgi:cytochrome c-type protein NapC